MRAGKLRHLVRIEQLVTGSPSRSPTGVPNQEWAEYATVWAAIEPLQGRELFAAQAVNSEITARITIRYLADIEAAMRVVFESLYYNILSVVDRDMRHIELQLMVSQGLNLG